MKYVQLAAAAALLSVAGVSASHAQAVPSRVFVAAQGSDTNSCTFAQPCRSFQQAHNTVAPRGEIDVLDPADYGAVTITKSISIQGRGFAGLAVASGDGITINAGASDAISLRGLLLDGVGTGNRGITFNSGGSLDVQDSLIRNFGLEGLVFGGSGAPNLFVSNTRIAGNGFAGPPMRGSGGMSVGGTGAAVIDHVLIENNAEVGLNVNIQMGCTIRDSSITGSLFYAVLASAPVLVTNSHISGGVYAAVGLLTPATAVIDHTVIDGGTIGLQIMALVGSFTVSNSVISRNRNGISFAASGNPVVMVLSDSDISGNFSTAVEADDTAIIRMTRSTVGNNGTGLATSSGGQIISYGDNMIGGNTTDGAPTSTVPLR
jgi:hypothetical protein